MQIVLRVFVTLLALLGIGGAIFLAVGLYASQALAETVTAPSLGVSSMEEAIKRADTSPGLQIPPELAEDLSKTLNAYKRGRKGVWFLDAAVPLGLFGIVLGLLGKGKCAAAILLAAFVGPVVILPPEALVMVAIITGGLAVAGLLAFFIRSTQRPHLAGSEA